MKTVVTLCRESYVRPSGLVLLCQYLPEHAVEHHSWWTAQCQDEADTAAERLDTTPAGVQAVLDAVSAGTYDLYLEALLAVAHNRKRARRGTPGFASGGPAFDPRPVVAR